MKGRPAPEFAVGLIHEKLIETSKFSSGQLKRLTNVLPAVECAVIYDSFEIGVGRLITSTALKLALWYQLPWRLCGHLS